MTFAALFWYNVAIFVVGATALGFVTAEQRVKTTIGDAAASKSRRALVTTSYSFVHGASLCLTMLGGWLRAKENAVVTGLLPAPAPAPTPAPAPSQTPAPASVPKRSRIQPCVETFLDEDESQ